jgi:hypothetical protein
LDYHVEVYTEATSSGKSSSSDLRRWVDDNWENVKPVKIDYGSVFELAVPISDLGITTGESIDVLVGRIESLIGSYF